MISLKKLSALIAASLCQAALAAPVLQNGSFETNNLGGNSFLYAGQVAATGWSFTGGAGVADNGPAWAGNTPFGNDYVMMQNISSVSQTFTSTATADYLFSFYFGQRSNYGAVGEQTVSVFLDSTLIWSGKPGTAWAQYSTSTYTLGAGSHTLTFQGTNLGGYVDTTAFLDNVVMTATDRALPEPASLALAGLGLCLLGRRRLRC